MAQSIYQDFFSRMDKSKNHFTKNEQIIEAFFRQNYHMIADLSIDDIALEVNVSKATISRFIRKLDYSGFNEFRYGLIRANELTSGNFAISDHFDFVTTLKNDYNMLIERATQLISKNDLTFFVSALAKANQIFTAGIGYSGLSAKEMSSKFVHIGKIIKPLDEASFINIHTELLQKNDMLIIFSLSGESLQLLRAATIAKEKGATVVAITNFAHSPLSDLADLTLLSAQKDDLQNAQTISTQFPQFFVIDILFNAVIESDPDKYRPRLEAYKMQQWKQLSRNK